MTKYKFAKQYFDDIVEIQRNELLASFAPSCIGTKYINIDYVDKNYKCMPLGKATLI